MERYFRSLNIIEVLTNRLVGDLSPISKERLEEARKLLVKGEDAYLAFQKKGFLGKKDPIVMMYLANSGGEIKATQVPGLHIVTGRFKQQRVHTDFIKMMKEGFRSEQDPNTALTTTDWKREVWEWGYPVEGGTLIRSEAFGEYTYRRGYADTDNTAVFDPIKGDSMRVLFWSGFSKYYYDARIFPDSEYGVRNYQQVAWADPEQMEGLIVLNPEADLSQRVNFYRSWFAHEEIKSPVKVIDPRSGRIVVEYGKSDKW